ncbi:WXG100 family type VII secretion target [Paenibacillus sp. 7516]|uniref:WXG100 family type VII secretion target n=1 Tax=Paenibacillus sp. 7516 TaxID=2022549 RepID=UPI000BA70AC1|nr:WXG100 family type VII secretion target [Paenibacillus sp. 7516]PAF29616.1 hypothetical protein CHI14_19855 [Paenibacillus sp. 7516]
MSTIKVTPEQLHHVSNQVDQARQQMESIRSDLTRQIMFIQAMWMGATQERFYYEFERSKPILERALESMINTSKDLKDIAARFQEVDAGQVSLAGATGAVGAMAMTTRLTGNGNSEDKGYRMAYNSAFGVWLPVNEKGVTDQTALQAYEKDKGNLDVKGMQGPMNMEPPGEDIFALQIKAFENGIHPFTGEPVSDKYAQTMVTSLKLSQIFMAVSMVKGSMPGSKGPFRLPSSNPAVAKIKKHIEAASLGATSSGNVAPAQRINNRYPADAQVGKEFSFNIENGRIKNVNGINEMDFVIDMNGKLHVGRGHSFLANGESVQAAGKLKINSDGRLRRITNLSGHYTPTVEQARVFPQILEQAGIKTKNAWLEVFSIDTTPSGYVNTNELVKVSSTKISGK